MIVDLERKNPRREKKEEIKSVKESRSERFTHMERQIPIKMMLMISEMMKNLKRKRKE